MPIEMPYTSYEIEIIKNIFDLIQYHIINENIKFMFDYDKPKPEYREFYNIIKSLYKLLSRIKNKEEVECLPTKAFLYSLSLHILEIHDYKIIKGMNFDILIYENSFNLKDGNLYRDESGELYLYKKDGSFLIKLDVNKIERLIPINDNSYFYNRRMTWVNKNITVG